MRSIELAMALDFLRRGWLWLLTAALFATASPLVLLAGIEAARGVDVPISLHVTVTMLTGLLTIIATQQAIGDLRRFYARPVSTTRLVACQLTLGMTAVVAICMVSVTAIHLAGYRCPVIGPTLFLATGFVGLMAIGVLLEGSVWFQIVVFGSLVGWALDWFLRRYGATWFSGQFDRMWQTPTAGELVTLFAAATIAAGAALWGVVRSRRGDSRGELPFVVWGEELATAWRSRPERFRSPLAAQLWVERGRFTVVPAGIIATVLGGLAVWCWCSDSSDRELLAVAHVLPTLLLAVVFPVLFGVAHGRWAGAAKRGGLPHWLAVRPVTDDFLARATLYNVAITISAAWLVWILGLALIALRVFLNDERGFGRALANDMGSHFGWVLIGVVWVVPCAWLIQANVATAYAARHRALLPLFILAGMLLPVYSLVCGWFSPETVAEWNRMLAAALGVSLIVATLALYVAAVRRQLLSARGAGIAGIAAVAITCLFLFWSAGEDVRSWQIWGTGIIFLAFLPVAGMPLAIASQRHQ